jgi:hypothetical protein
MEMGFGGGESGPETIRFGVGNGDGGLGSGTGPEAP